MAELRLPRHHESGNFTREGMSVFDEHIWLLPDDLGEENKLYRFALNELLNIERESLRVKNWKLKGNETDTNQNNRSCAVDGVSIDFISDVKTHGYGTLPECGTGKRRKPGITKGKNTFQKGLAVQPALFA